MDRRSLVEGADQQPGFVNCGVRRNLPGPVPHDVRKLHQDLAFAAVVVGVAAGVRVPFQAGVGRDGPDLDVTGVCIAPLPLPKESLERLAAGIGDNAVSHKQQRKCRKHDEFHEIREHDSSGSGPFCASLER